MPFSDLYGKLKESEITVNRCVHAGYEEKALDFSMKVMAIICRRLKEEPKESVLTLTPIVMDYYGLEKPQM